MRFRSSVAIDLGTVNTLVWVAGRGILLELSTDRPEAEVRADLRDGLAARGLVLSLAGEA